MKLVLGALAAVMAVGLSSVAQAETRTLARAGVWQAFGGTTNEGRSVCGMSATGDGKYFSIKYFSGNQTLTLQLGSKSWTIKNGAKQQLAMSFDGNSPWNATATGFHFADGDAGLEFTINRNELTNFMREFRLGNQMRITFTGSTASGWVGNLSGTNAMSDAFVNCISRM
jgi:hypothetical protein